MLVIYNKDTGEITQCVMQAQQELPVLSKRYDEMGIANLLYDGTGDMSNLYVKDGAVTPKPEMTITGEDRPLKADGIDTLSFQIEPGTLDITVVLDDKIIQREQVTDGILAFSVDHAGSYGVFVGPPFPYRTAILSIEAV